MFTRLGTVPLVLFLVVSTSSAVEGPFRNATFDEARAVAEKEGKIIMIDFYTTWCGPCKMLDKTTWTDKKVQAFLAEKTVPLKIDAEKEGVELAEKYRIRAYPTLLFVKADGTEIDRLVGYKNPSNFLAEAAESVAGRDSLTRVKEKVAKDPDNPLVRMELASAYGYKGLFKESLAELLWCHDHGTEKHPEFRGVRASFLLTHIAMLGREYPPALEALKERRASAEQAVLSGNLSEVGSCVGLHRVLGDKAATLALFDKVTKPETKAAMTRFIVEQLIEAKRYSDIASNIPNLLDEARTEIKNTQENLDELGKDKNQAEFAEYFKKSGVENAGKYHEALVGVGKLEDAGKVAEEILKFDSGWETHAVLINGAKHAANEAVVKTLTDKALKSLSKQDGERLSKEIEEPAAKATK